MLRTANGFHRFALLLLVLAGLPVRAAVAQGLPHRPWTITADFTGLRIGGSSGWVYGPELGIRRDFGPRWGLELTASLPVLDPKLKKRVVSEGLRPYLDNSQAWEMDQEGQYHQRSPRQGKPVAAQETLLERLAGNHSP